jgi:hypothetical protein
MIRSDGFQAWWLHGKRHRVDGPAVIYPSGRQEWWINDQDITHRVENWIVANDYPEWREWSEEIWIQFRARFL